MTNETQTHREKSELVALAEWSQGRNLTDVFTAVIYLLVQAHQHGHDITLYKEAVDQLNADADALVNLTNARN